MPRGDLRLVHFAVTSADGNDPPAFTEIYATFKKSFRDPAYLFQKKLSDGTIIQLEDGSYQFAIEPQDTDNLSYGQRVFDIEFIYEDQIKETHVGEFILTEEATFAANEDGDSSGND